MKELSDHNVDNVWEEMVDIMPNEELNRIQPKLEKMDDTKQSPVMKMKYLCHELLKWLDKKE